MSRTETSATVEVQTRKDDVDESNETLILMLGNAIGARVCDAVGIETIIGDMERRIRLANRAYLPAMGRTAELSIEDDLGVWLRSRGTTLGSGALGVHARLFSRGATTVTVKGEAGIAQYGVADPGVEFGPAALDLSRLKFAAEAAREYKFPGGDTFAHWGELSVRHDGGEGETGTLRVAPEEPALSLSKGGVSKGCLTAAAGSSEGWRAVKIDEKAPRLPSASSNSALAKPATSRGLPSGAGRLERLPPQSPSDCVTARVG